MIRKIRGMIFAGVTGDDPVRPGQHGDSLYCDGGLRSRECARQVPGVHRPGWGRVRRWPAECAAAPLHRQGRFAFPYGNGRWPPLTAEPLCRLRSVIKGQAAACPDRTRAIPCTVRAVAHRVPNPGDRLSPCQCGARICARDVPGSGGTPETQVSAQEREQDDRPGQEACQRPGGPPETCVVWLITQRRTAHPLRARSPRPNRRPLRSLTAKPQRL